MTITFDPSNMPHSRVEAELFGVRYYLSDSICHRGHEPAVRVASSGSCVFCRRIVARDSNQRYVAKLKETK